MLNKNELNQTATAHIANQAGRDINNIITPKHVSRIRELSQRIKEKYDEDEYHLISKLKHFMTEKIDEDIQGLEDKLTAGGRDDLIMHAMELKELFYKRIHREPFSTEAQELFVHLLSLVRNTFQYQVHSKIKANATNKEIDCEIFEKILTPIYNEIGACKVDIDMDDIAGMLYFLTGNCHIRWEA